MAKSFAGFSASIRISGCRPPQDEGIPPICVTIERESKLPVNWWYAQVLKGPITSGIELYYRIIRPTAAKAANTAHFGLHKILSHIFTSI